MTIIETLKKIRIKPMCDELGLDYKRIRNYLCGAVKELNEEEITAIRLYISHLTVV